MNATWGIKLTRPAVSLIRMVVNSVAFFLEKGTVWGRMELKMWGVVIRR